METDLTLYHLKKAIRDGDTVRMKELAIAMCDRFHVDPYKRYVVRPKIDLTQSPEPMDPLVYHSIEGWDVWLNKFLDREGAPR